MKKNMIVLCVLAAAFVPASVYATGTSAVGGSGISSIVMLVALFAIMYFLMIRPQQKKEKETANMRNNLKVGDDIVTIGGIYGTIVRIKDDKITIAVGAAQTKLEIAKWAISGLDKPAESTTKKGKKEEAEEKKPTPKTIKKLGAKKEEEQSFLDEQKEAETPSAE